MSGQWPPEWQDPDWEDSDTGLPDKWTPDEAELGQDAPLVASFLSSAPSPVLPAAFEARISAAIAAEASARADGAASAVAALSARAESTANGATAGSGGTEAEPVAAGPVDPWTASAVADDAESTGRSISPELSPTAAESGAATSARHRRRRTAGGSRAARSSGPADSRPGGRRRRFRMPSPAVGGPLVVLLIIAGFALVFSQLGGSSATYSGTSGLASGATASSAASSATRMADGGSFGASAPKHENQSGASTRKLSFSVTESGASFHQSTLVTQVREQLDALLGPAATPAASSSASTAASAPAPSAVSSASSTSPATVTARPAFAGCVAVLTHGVTPTLVDKGTYDGIPAYIIAIPSRVWVVRLGCTAADPMQITSASLSG
jgi:hypothetical protein